MDAKAGCFAVRHLLDPLRRRRHRARGGKFSYERKGSDSGRLPLARVTGLEPATSGVTGRRSNQLSYTRSCRGERVGWAASGVKGVWGHYGDRLNRPEVQAGGSGCGTVAVPQAVPTVQGRHPVERPLRRRGREEDSTRREARSAFRSFHGGRLPPRRPPRALRPKPCAPVRRRLHPRDRQTALVPIPATRRTDIRLLPCGLCFESGASPGASQSVSHAVKPNLPKQACPQVSLISRQKRPGVQAIALWGP